MNVSIHMYMTYTYIYHIDIDFSRQKGDCAHLSGLTYQLNNVLPVRPSCFNQAFLDSSGRRTYIVTTEEVVGEWYKENTRARSCALPRLGDTMHNLL